MKKMITLIFLLATLNTFAQLGRLDNTFISGEGTDQPIYSMVKQSDGKMLIGGNFTIYNNQAVSRISRINANGSLDNTFNSGGTGANNLVYVLALQPSGKIFATGFFDAYNGVLRNKIARVNDDGTLDNDFDPGTGLNAIAHSFITLPSGKIIVAGFFTTYNDVTVNYIARVEDDGSLDDTFNSGGAGANGPIYKVLRLEDDRMMIIGNFTEYNGSPANGIARIKADGTLDNTFNPGMGVDGSINTIIEQANDQFLIAGNFTSYNGTTVNNIARIDFDGSLDASFNAGGAGADGVIYTLAEQPNGKILLGGSFSNYNGQSSQGIVRINTNGTIDPNFNPGTGATGGANQAIWDIVLQPDGKAVITGSFTEYNGITKNNIAGILVSEPVLPVSFGKFMAMAQNDKVKLSWNTLSETNNQLFMAYRSIDAINYTPIATQISKGGGANSYTVFDNQPANGINYYRLTQKDIDGKVTILANAAVNFSLSGQNVKIWPNPVVDLLNVNLTPSVYQTLILTNVNGQKLQELSLKKTQNSVQLNLTAYPKGVYVIQLKGENNMQSIKVLK